MGDAGAPVILLSAERVAAVVVAAGRGARVGVPEKVLLPLAGSPMIAWTLRALERAERVGSVVVVAGAHTREAIARLVRDEGFAKVCAVVVGEERRQDSVAAGLAALPEGIEVIVVHDGARPMAEAELFDRCVRAAAETGAAIAATPIADTLKRAADGLITGTVEREGVWAAQTPQAFRLSVLREAMAAHAGETVTDEALLCEAAGLPVRIVPASPANLKVTRPEDIAVAEALLRARIAESGSGSRAAPRDEEARLGNGAAPGEPGCLAGAQHDTVGMARTSPSMRTGIGYDAHRFATGRRLVLGGVEIPHERGLAGHSDADVVLHAIADAVLGAAALGDIGTHFPPSDARYQDADSRELLRESVRLAREAGWTPVNVDATVLAEAPRIGPHVPAMRTQIAASLGIEAAAVGVKATTNEGMGAIGRGEGMAALAVATLVPLSSPDG
jgi:2-C-methyl-D-erythritol 4-phosphate cytidylyltransferase/2-C-methyl-D-erythritol 2,4-cyclodiphosphate synthase